MGIGNGAHHASHYGLVKGEKMGNQIELHQCSVLQGLTVLYLLEQSPHLAIGSIYQGAGEDGMINVIFDTGPRRTDFRTMQLCWAGWANGTRQVLPTEVDYAPLLERWHGLRQAGDKVVSLVS